MIALKPYPGYHESVVEWLECVPTHWSERRGKTLFQKLERPVEPESETVTCFRDGTVTLRRNRRTTGFTEALQEIGYQGVKQGDLVVHAMDAFAGAVGVSDSDGKCSPVYSVCGPIDQVHPSYYARVVREMALNGFIQAQAKGIRERSTDFRFEGFGRSLLPFPPLDEQRAIADFLDAMDARITRFIAARKKMTRLLEEKKQAVINQAVTKGLDPTVPMKDSGVEWLGDIPAHWQKQRLKNVTSDIVDCLHATPEYDPDGKHPAIRTSDVQPGKVLLEKARRISSDEYERWTERLTPQEGDILYSREGDYGIAAPVPHDANLAISQRMMVFRSDKSCDSQFLMWQLNGDHVLAQASIDAEGSTVPHVNITTIRNYQLAIPSVAEQRCISAYIDSELRRLDAIVARSRRELELMQEYRTRLISDVVTGKLDVRGVDLGELPEFDEIPAAAEAIDLTDDEVVAEEIAGAL